MTSLFTKIDHIAINTLNIERSMIFYQQTFGFKHYFETTRT
ncbi:VOC family protein [Fangia hongkongensis]|nr:VOC family protein [Fangia hongkongensis]